MTTNVEGRLALIKQAWEVNDGVLVRTDIEYLLRLARLAVRASDSMIEHDYNFSAADGEKIHRKDCDGCEWLRAFNSATSGEETK